MKHLLLLVTMIIPFLSFGESYFRDGMKWDVLYVGTETPEGVYGEREFFIEGEAEVDGFEALKLYSVYENDNSTKELVSYLRNDGEKVLFWNEFAKKWFLMYDFSLQPGEGVEAYSIPQSADIAPKSEYIKCVGVYEDKSLTELPILKVEAYESKESSLCRGEAGWIVGLGCTAGVYHNVLFGLDGMGSVLLEASFGDDLIYKDEKNYRPAGIKTIDTVPCAISVENKSLILSDINVSGVVEIHSADGVLVESRRVSDKEATFSLPSAGIYILSIGDYSRKICVR